MQMLLSGQQSIFFCLLSRDFFSQQNSKIKNISMPHQFSNVTANNKIQFGQCEAIK